MRCLTLFACAVLLGACDQRAPAPPPVAAQAPAAAQTMGSAPAPGIEASDTRVVANIKMALQADRELSRFVIDVDSKDGLVVLSGVARSESARQRAEQIARATPQVHAIENQLTLRQG